MDVSGRKIHPLIALAALSVLIFSVIASAKALGWLPIGTATAAESERVAEVLQDPAAKEVAKKPSTTVRVAEVKQQAIQQKPYAEYGHQSKATTERYSSCVDCGVVTGITPIAAASNGPTGIGAVLGAVAGGVIGHQIGGGNGKKVATVAGALGGAYAGNRYEGSRVKGYEMSVRLDSGEVRSIYYDNNPGFSVGDAIRMSGNQVIRR